MAVRFTTTIELDVEVHGSVDFPVSPRGWDPGDPGGCEIEAVLVKLPGSHGGPIDILSALSAGQLAELEEQLQVCAEEQAQDAYNAAAEARYDAKKEGD